jgi:hypothetical protein
VFTIRRGAIVTQPGFGPAKLQCSTGESALKLMQL